MKISDVIREGITHIEDLPVHEFINAVRNLNSYHVSEKIDGFNLKFGVDEQGFYTRGKGDRKIRRAEEWGKQFRYTGFKSAHAALVDVLPQILKIRLLNPGDEVEAEVLFGELPNTVPYTGETNKIILLRTITGTADIDKLKAALDNKTVSVNVLTPFTPDGRTIKKEVRSHIWTFAQTPRVKMDAVNIVKEKKIEDALKIMQDFLLQDSGIETFSNAEALALPLNKRPEDINAAEWKFIKDELKTKKEEIQEFLMGQKLEIKDRLLNQLVRKIQSRFGPEIRNGGWIEGVVLRKTEDDETELIKIVDKDVFTALNKFNWHIRSKVGGNPKGINSVDSIIGKMKISMARAVHHPELATQQKNRYIKKHNLTVEGIANEIDYQQTKEIFTRALNRGENMLERYHNVYEKRKSHTYKDIDFGEFRRRFKIDPALDQKNLEAFAELYDIIRLMKNKVETAYSAEDLVKVVFGDIDELFEGNSLRAFGEWLLRS